MWTTLIVISNALLDKVDGEDFNLKTFEVSMNDCRSRPVRIGSFFPDVEGAKHRGLGLKSQLSGALMDYMIPKG